MAARAEVVLGRAQYGARPPVWDLGAGHVLVAGTTGAGKSSWTNSAVGGLAPLAHVQPVGVDLKRVELSPWSGRLAALARVPEEVGQLATMLDRLLTARAALADEHRWRSWPASIRAPYVPVIVDELAEAATVDGFLEVAVRIGRIGRALGVVMLGATQQANAKTLGGTDLRALMTRRACLFDPEPESRRMTLGSEADRKHGALLAWLSMDRQGLAVWSDPAAYPVPWLCRAYYWQDRDVDRMVAATAHLARPLAELLEPTVEVAA